VHAFKRYLTESDERKLTDEIPYSQPHYKLLFKLKCTPATAMNHSQAEAK